MRLAFLSDAIYPFHHGGKETLQHERAIRLARRGHAVRVHTMHWWPERERETIRDGIVLHAIGPRVPMYTRAARRSVWESLIFGLASLRLLWAAPFDVLDVDQFPYTPFFAARLACRLRGRPMTATWYEVWDRNYWRSYMGWLAPLGAFLQWFAARSADLIFADSELTARRLTGWLGVDPSRVMVLSPGIESTQGAAGPPSYVGGGVGSGSEKTIDCIFVGRLLPHKHVDVMLRALARLPGVSGLVIGSGPERERLLALSESLGVADRVTFAAAASPEVVQRHLRQSRLFVFPSTREGFGLVVLEANAVGVPALVVEHPDNAAIELVDDGVNGLICHLDVDAVAEQIHRYLEDPAAQARLSKAAVAGAARYSWDAYVNRMEAALERLAPSLQKAA
jgi:glycosyltransferase involved in cell wall biosynthesis